MGAERYGHIWAVLKLRAGRYELRLVLLGQRLRLLPSQLLVGVQLRLPRERVSVRRARKAILSVIVDSVVTKTLT